MLLEQKKTEAIKSNNF